jgi:osmoprotectant transport system substrate-binding protein
MTPPTLPATSRPRGRRAGPAVLAALALALGVLLTACGAGEDPLATAPRGPSPEGTVRVGSGNFSESRLLAEIYAQGLEIRGVKVERSFGIGSRETYLPAITGGEIDLIPEYTGNLLQNYDKQATATAPDQVYQQVQGKLPPSLTLLNPSPAQDSDAVVVTRAFAEQNQLRSIEDLARLCPTIAFGGPPEFQQRAYGIAGLQRNYGCTFKEFRPLDSGGPLTVAALRDGTVQAADIFTTDSSIPENGFTVLADPKSNFAAQNIVPLINKAKTGDPRVVEVLNKISAQLDTTVLTDLNRQLNGPDKPDPAQVARGWLASAGVG